MTARVRLVGPDGERIITIDSRLEVGRECDGEVIDDPQVSRRHLAIEEHQQGVLVTDLGSANGTWVNGTRIDAPTFVGPGDVVRLGETELVPVAPDAVPSTATVTTPAAPVPTSAAAPAPAAPAPAAGVAPRDVPVRAALASLASLDVGAAVLRFRPGTAGEQQAGRIGDAIRAARKRLAGFGSEPWGLKPQVCLVDPFDDPADPGSLLTEGTIVDADNQEIWIVVTPESPPAALEPALAILFGSSLPAGRDLELLLEGFGATLRPEAATDAEVVRRWAITGTTLEDTTGDERAATLRSFVSYLVERAGRQEFMAFLAGARPGQVDGAAHATFGAGLSSLEETWRQRNSVGDPPVKAGRFLSMSLPYLRAHKWRQAEIFAYMLLGLGFTMAFPFVFRKLIDEALPSGEYSQVAGLLGLLGAVFAISLLANLRRSYLSAYVSSSMVRDLRGEMFGKLQDLSARWFGLRQQGDVMTRLFSDVGMMESGLSQVLRDGLFQLLSLIVAAVVLILLNPVLAAVVLVGAPLVALVYRFMSDGARKRSMAAQEELAGVYSIAGESYSAHEVVTTFGLQDHERTRFARASQRMFQRELKLQLFGGYFGLSVSLIVTVLRIGVLALGAKLVFDGQLTVGGLVAFMSLMGEVIGPVTGLTSLGQQLQAASGSLQRVLEVLEATPDIADAPDAVAVGPLRQDLRLAGVSFAYTPERPTLRGVDCTIPAGRRVAFVGPTGAGKSSVLKLLMRAYDPDEGGVFYDGTDLRRASLASLRDQLGVVFQESFLFEGTIGENIALGQLGATEAQVIEAAKAAELHDFVMGLPRGYDTLVGERGGRLSGGQRQRVAIARAILRNPSVLLLDEATSALDPRTERLISQTLIRVGEGRTTIAITHRLTSVVDYDCIFVVSDGTIVQQGRHDDLVQAGGVYGELWAEQVGFQDATAESPALAPTPDPSARLSRLTPVISGDRSPNGTSATAARLALDGALAEADRQTQSLPVLRT